MSYLGIDTAAKINAVQAKTLRREGVSFACRYLVPESGNTAWKAISAAEAQILRDAGLAVLLCWETTANRPKSGATAGAADGAEARKLAAAMGVPDGTVVFFAADYAVPQADYDAVYQYLVAASKAIYPYSAGLYGPEGIVGAMNERAACEFFWQCVGGSTKFLDCASVIQYESQYGADAIAMASKIGVAVDLDSAETLDGMWKPPAPRTEEEDAIAWAKGVHIIDDSMRDVSQTVLMLYRYFKTYEQEDTKNYSWAKPN